MSSFINATRRSRRGTCEDKSSTFMPSSSPSKLPPAVRKLVSENGWVHKASATKKQVIPEATSNKKQTVVESVIPSDGDSSSEE